VPAARRGGGGDGEGREHAAAAAGGEGNRSPRVHHRTDAQPFRRCAIR
jgi:hypothetical protein